MQTCDVCCEKYNQTFHRKLTCSRCDHTCCRRCAQTYLLSTYDDPHCMKCNTKWSREFVDSWCSKVFRNTEYRKHREESLFLREQLYFQETQVIVERIMRIRQLREELWQQRDKLVRLHRFGTTEPELRREVQKFDDLFHELHTLENQHENLTTETNRRFTRKCPTPECKGFMSVWSDEKNHYCGLCKRVYCDECNHVHDEGHVCDEESRSTFQLIQRDSRPCPKCGEMITKIIGGCDQMFCTGCKTAFSWRTGEIETGRIHNPHFFEYKRAEEGKIGRELGDIPCGGLPSFRELREMGAPETIVRYRIMINTVERQLMWMGNGTETDNRRTHTQRYRIQFMANSITEKQFRQAIQQVDKRLQKESEVRDVFEMMLNCTSDLLRQYVVHPEQQWIVWEQLESLRTYVNDIIRGSIWKRYNCVTPSLLYY